LLPEGIIRLMKTIRTLIIISFLTGAFVQMAFAQAVWVKYGWQLFKQAGNARSIALGGAQTGNGSGIPSILWNPAHYDEESDRFFTYAHQSRFAGIVNSDLAAFSLHTPARRPIEMVLLHESVTDIPDTRGLLLDWGLDGIPGTRDAGEGNGILDEGERLNEDKLKRFNQRQWGVYLSTVWRIKSTLLGLGIKGLFHSLGEYYGSGFGVDLGLKRPLWSGAQLGLVIKDVTTSWLVWENGITERTLPSFVAGVSQMTEIPFVPVKVTLSGDIVINGNGRSLDDDFRIREMGGNYRLGAEVRIKNKLLLRFGRNDIATITSGLGMEWSSFTIDYAFQLEPPSSGLGNSHLISFSVDPQWLKSLL